ncbi:hypothetical protein [Ornithinimicrobium kibberense]|uniref:hypothetical protein n=1 Tax=Ornithinimicrobium kibberense TaxID=282060 RepID=UPI0036157D77
MPGSHPLSPPGQCPGASVRWDTRPGLMPAALATTEGLTPALTAARTARLRASRARLSSSTARSNAAAAASTASSFIRSCAAVAPMSILGPSTVVVPDRQGCRTAKTTA